MGRVLKTVFMFFFAVSFIIADLGTDTDAVARTNSSAQTICPVMGGSINRNIYTDYKGERIYFCCPGCPEEFKKNPGRYLKKMKESGVVLEKTPAK